MKGDLAPLATRMLLGHTQETDAAGDGGDRGCDDAPLGSRWREREAAASEPDGLARDRPPRPAQSDFRSMTTPS